VTVINVSQDSSKITPEFVVLETTTIDVEVMKSVSKVTVSKNQLTAD
jgi:hypothetical protein